MNIERLSALGAEWVKWDENPSPVLEFNCPNCRKHLIAVCFAQPSLFPSGAVWCITSGSHMIDTLSVFPSIDLTKTCGFHGWIESGEVRW